jgi:hypothetical protein
MSEAFVRRVVVSIPFNTGDAAGVRAERVLQFFRIKHLVEKRVDVWTWVLRPARPELEPPLPEQWEKTRIEYDVRVVQHGTGRFMDVITRLVAADVLIVVLAPGNNINVMYEMAMRTTLRGGVILLVEDRDALPAVLGDAVWLDWNDVASTSVKGRMAEFARAESARGQVLHFDSEIPGELQTIIDADVGLAAALERALRDIESGIGLHPHYPDLLKYISPGDVLDNWKTIFPISIVSITWRTKRGASYDPNDALRGPLIYWANSLFLGMLGIAELPLPFGPGALTATRLVELLTKREYIEANDLEEFLAEQKWLMPRVFFEESEEPARVPLRFNERAPERLRDKWLLPTIVGKNVVGSTTSTHTSFVAVVYTPVPNIRKAAADAARALLAASRNEARA